MKFNIILPIACTAALFAVSCAENPADSVPKADVSEAPAETPEAPTPAPAAEEPVPTPAPEASAEAVAYAFTDESKIEFVGSKVTGSHEGGFTSFDGTFSVAGDQPGAGPHQIVIDMTSVWSDNDKLTGHLKSPDFFDVATYPKSTFTVSGVDAADGADAYTMSGTLELHGKTKAISFPATVTKGDGGKVMMNSEFAINRKDFGIDYPGKADDLIRNEVVIRLAMVATPAE